jgi:MFS family permease
LLTGLLICQGAAQLLYMNISTFLPLYVEDYHPSLKGLDIGILLSVYQVSFLITAPTAGEKMGDMGRRRTIILALLLASLATTIFGTAAFFTETWVFYSVSLIARAI